MVNSMIRTKHIIIFAALLLGIVAAILLTLIFFPSGTVSLRGADISFLPPDNYTQPVSVSSSVDTEPVRTSLIQKLLAIGPRTPAPQPEVVNEPEEVAVPVFSGRTFEVSKGDGTKASLTLPETGTYDGVMRELVSDIVGVTFYGTWIRNGDVSVYGGNAGSHALVGYALDGFAIYADVSATDLDQCHGHASDLSGIYHYHVTPSGVLGCFSSEPVDIGPYTN